MDFKDKQELKSAERRNFLKLAGTGSFTAAMVAGAGGVLWSDQAAAQTAQEERAREDAADHIMTLATAYRPKADLETPWCKGPIGVSLPCF